MIDWFANQKGKKKKKGSDLVMVALQTKALTANPRNTGGCQIKKPGKMRTKEREKKKEYGGRLENNPEREAMV